jgi:hypothetical protein
MRRRDHVAGRDARVRKRAHRWANETQPSLGQKDKPVRQARGFMDR